MTGSSTLDLSGLLPRRLTFSPFLIEDGLRENDMSRLKLGAETTHG